LRIKRMLPVTPAWLLGFFLPTARLVPIPVPGVREAISSTWASTPWLMKAMKKSKPLELAIDKANLEIIRHSHGEWTHVASLRYQKLTPMPDHVAEAQFMRRPISILFTAARSKKRFATQKYVTKYVTVMSADYNYGRTCRPDRAASNSRLAKTIDALHSLGRRKRQASHPTHCG